jgi:hypothetical protein
MKYLVLKSLVISSFVFFLDKRSVFEMKRASGNGIIVWHAVAAVLPVTKYKFITELWYYISLIETIIYTGEIKH